jgi:DNA-binding NarL/FixJ family response regulator
MEPLRRALEAYDTDASETMLSSDRRAPTAPGRTRAKADAGLATSPQQQRASEGRSRTQSSPAAARQNPTLADSPDGTAATQPISIIIVDDHRFMREVISAMLARQAGRYNVVAEKADAATAIDACKELAPDLLILDINLPDLSGIDAVREVKKVAPGTRILLCTAYVSDERVVGALRSGAHGFVEKTNTWDDFIEAIERVSRGEHFFSSHTRTEVSDASAAQRNNVLLPPPAALSSRENEVLLLVARGYSSKEVAGKLGISVGTVDVHRANLMKKLHTRNVAGLVAYAFHTGLLK